MRGLKFLGLIMVMLQSISTVAQSGWMQPVSKKGQLSISWGYNRAWFTDSDIEFTGDDYAFTLSDVKSFDRPTAFDFDTYFNITTFTIPQYNIKFGYFIKDNWAIHFSSDHMKYVMPQDQEVLINGYINHPTSIYQGEFTDEAILLEDTFLQFEHTDGLNYLSLGVDNYQNIYAFNEIHSINFMSSLGAGILMPKSNVKLMGEERNDEFHVAGFGLSLKAGIDITLWKYFFIRTGYQGGYINMPDVLTMKGDVEDRASHSFWYGMWDIGLGGSIPLSSNK